MFAVIVAKNDHHSQQAMSVCFLFVPGVGHVVNVV
jgi:hypothetical protein